MRRTLGLLGRLGGVDLKTAQ